APTLSGTATSTLTGTPTSTHTAASTPTLTPTIGANDRVEMSAHGLLTSMDGIHATGQLQTAVLDFGCAGAGGCGGTHAQSAAHPATLSPAAPLPCPDGGTVLPDCIADQSSTTFSAVYADCHTTDPATGNPATIDGSLVQSFSTPDACGSGLIPDA